MLTTSMFDVMVSYGAAKTMVAVVSYQVIFCVIGFVIFVVAKWLAK